MNQQDESALVDSFFSPGGLLDPDKINDGNDADFPTTTSPLSQTFIDVDHGFVVPTIIQSTAVTSTTHLPLWNNIFHHDVTDRDIGAFSAEQNPFINVTLPFPHHHDLFAPNNTTGQQGIVSPAPEPSLLTVPALDHSEQNRQQYYHYHAERIEHGAFLYRHQELNVVYDSTMDNREDDMNEEIWFSQLITGDCEFNRQSVITAGVQQEGTMRYQQDSRPFVFSRDDQPEPDYHGRVLKVETSHVVADNEEEYDGNDTDVMARTSQQPLPLQLLNVTDSCDQSASTTSSLSTTSSCAVQSQQLQNRATEVEEEQEEVLPAVPSIVTTCSRRKRYNERLKCNDDVDDLKAAADDDKISSDQSKVFGSGKNIQNISQSSERSMNYSNDFDDEDKIINGILDDDTNIVDDVRPEQLAIHEKTLVISPPDPSPPVPKIKLSPEWNALWSDATTNAAEAGAVTSVVLESNPQPTGNSDTSRNPLPTKSLCCSSADRGTLAVPLSPPKLAAGTPSSSVRETKEKEPFQHPRKRIKWLSSRVQKIRGAVTRTWRNILDRLAVTARVIVRLLAMLYSLVFLLCLESLGELKDHPSSMLCFAIFYATPRACHVLMDLVNLPYWTPHVLSTVLVVSVCYPIKNGTSSRTCTTALEGMVSKEQCDGSNNRDRSMVQRWEQQVSAVILWLIRLYMACLFFYDGFSEEGFLWRMNDMTRLLVASLLTLVRYERILSPVSWICWSVQVIVAALLPSCFATEVLVVLMALSSARYLRASGLCTVISKKGTDL